MCIVSLEQIHAAIPHRDPFLLLDEILEWEEKRIVCARQLTGDEFWFRGHYPEQPIMPGVLQCEAALQAGAVLLSKFVTDPLNEKVPVATRLNNVRFKQIVFPGQRIEITVDLTDQVSDAFYLQGKITSNGKLSTRLDFACTVAPVPQPQDG